MHKYITPVMITIGIVQIILWGVAPLLASDQVAKFFGLTHTIEYAHWVRYFGMMGVMWGLMLVTAAFKPRENKLIIFFSMILFIFAIILTLIMYWIGPILITQWIWWLNLALCVIFALALALCYPRAEKPAKPAAPAQV